MTTTGDRNYYATMGNNGINLPANGVSPPLAGVYPFVPGNDNVPGVAAKTPALVALADGARMTGVNTSEQPANNPRQGQGDSSFVQQAASPVGPPTAAAVTNDTLEGPGAAAVGSALSPGVATVLAGLSNGQQEHGFAVHATGF